MGTRLELHEILLEVGPPNAYFQPPADSQMEYPCTVYELADEDAKFADNKPYSHKRRYQVTIIDEDPDSDYPFAIRMLPTCVFNRSYPADNLNHFVYNLFF